MRRRGLILCVLGVLLAAQSGCGGKFQLPTERPGAGQVPTDQSYAMLATWTGMTGVQDVFITQGLGNQLFVLFNNGGTGGPGIARGEVKLFPLTQPKPIGPPFFDALRTLFNPVALTAGTNPAAPPNARLTLFVLDQGDSCQAKYDARIGSCQPDQVFDTGQSRPYQHVVHDYTATWRVREYRITGGDTLGTFTDTTVAEPWGIAADDEGRVYVGATAVFLDSNQTDKRIRTRKHVSRIYRYVRGQKYPGINDVNMPGTSLWHRDSTWYVLDGTGDSFVSDPRGLHWSPLGLHPLFVADRGNNQAKGVSVNSISVPYVNVDGQVTGANFNSPEGVTSDLAGYFYVVDRANRRVLRFTTAGEYVQRVDVELNADGLQLLDPVSIAVDDSLAYIADRGRSEIVRYKRRP